MSHFVNDDKMNIFRLPVGWQFLVNNPGDQLNSGNFAKYDNLVQACLATGAACIIDVSSTSSLPHLICKFYERNAYKITSIDP